MLLRIAILGCVLALPGCGGEPERSRVVPASAERGRADTTARPADRESYKIETH